MNLVKFLRFGKVCEVETYIRDHCKKAYKRQKSETCVKIPKSHIVLWKIAKVSLWKTPYITRRLSSTWVLEWKFVSYKPEVQVSFIGVEVCGLTLC